MNTLLKRALGLPGIDGRLQALFARGIDPGDEATTARGAAAAWPTPDEMHRCLERADRDLLDALNAVDLEAEGEAGEKVRQALYTWLEERGREHPLFWERHDGRWHWHGMFEPIPLPLGWPVYVSHAEAAAYARWTGTRLPTEAELHRAAYGTPSGRERGHPWGDAPPDATRGNLDFAHWDPVPVGSRPAGRSASGVRDLVGNGWEWTSTLFDGFPGFRPMWSYPEYSADFFDREHYVMKGASPATARRLVRRSFRNWFRPRYPYVYAAFRCVPGETRRAAPRGR